MDRFEAVDAPTVGGWPKPVARANPHELLSCVTALATFGDALEGLGVDPAEVCGYVLGWSLAYEAGASWQYGVGPEVLHSPVDVDRLDYMVRDDHMTGADVLNVDTGRMIAAYTAHPDAGLALSEQALSAVGNYLEGRVSLYQWVTQHHKSVYANVLLQRLLDELERARAAPLVTADAVLDEGIDDYWLFERFREAAADPPSEAFRDLYRRFRSRDFAESCWKHRLGYGDVIAADAAEQGAYSRWLVGNDTRLERLLAERFGLPEHEVWIERSYVPEYEPAELRDIPLAHNGRTQSVAEHGLYGGREFERAIPFVYVPEGYTDAAVDALNERFSAEHGGAGAGDGN
ncbi:HD domain-containing protein [Halosegnis marinus]|uniref:HD domain-containing protein n=1 Tax=Halosegnis marinus TaxID=3034023 RepID=UPI00360CCECB